MDRLLIGPELCRYGALIYQKKEKLWAVCQKCGCELWFQGTDGQWYCRDEETCGHLIDKAVTVDGWASFHHLRAEDRWEGEPAMEEWISMWTGIPVRDLIVVVNS